MGENIESKFEMEPEIKLEQKSGEIKEEKDYGEELLKSIKEEIEDKIPEDEKKQWEEITREIKSFKEENFEDYKKILGKVENFSFTSTQEETKEAIEELFKEEEKEGISKKTREKIAKIYLLGDLIDIEKLNPPKEMRDFIDKETKKNKWIDSWMVENLMKTNPSKEDYKVLDRVSELEIATFGQKDIFKEKGELYKTLLDDEKFEKFKNQFNFLKEIDEEVKVPSVDYLKEVFILLGDKSKEILSGEAKEVIEKISFPKEAKKILSSPKKKEKVIEILAEEIDKCGEFQKIVEYIKPEKEMRELIVQEINQSRKIDWDFKWNVKRLIELNLSKEDYKVLERMNELNLGNLGDLNQADVIKREEDFDKNTYQTFSKLASKEFEEIKKRASILKEIYGEELKMWPSTIDILSGEKGEEFSSKNFQDLVKNLEKNYNFKVENISHLKEISEFSKEEKEKLLSKDFQKKIGKLKKDYNLEIEIKHVDRIYILGEISSLPKEEMEKFLSPEFQKIAKDLEQNYDFIKIEDIIDLRQINNFSKEKTEKLLSRDFIEAKNKIEKNSGFKIKYDWEINDWLKLSDKELEILSLPEFKKLIKNITEIWEPKEKGKEGVKIEDRISSPASDLNGWLKFIKDFSLEKMEFFSSSQFAEKIKEKGKESNFEIKSRDDVMNLFEQFSDKDLEEILSSESKKKIKNIEAKYNLKESISIKSWLELDNSEIEILFSDEFRKKTEKIVEIYPEQKPESLAEVRHWLKYSKDNFERISSKDFKKKVEDIEEKYKFKESVSFYDFERYASYFSSEEFGRVSSDEFKNKIGRIEEIFNLEKVKDVYNFDSRLSLSDKEIERLLSKEFQDTINKIQTNYNLRKIEDFGGLLNWAKLSEKEIKKILSPEFVKIPKMYNFAMEYPNTSLETLIDFSEGEINNLSSEKFIKRAKNFRLKFTDLYEIRNFASLDQEKEIFSKKETEIEKILSDFKLGEIKLDDFRRYFSSFSGEEIDKVLERDFDKDLMKKLSPLVENTPFYKQISSEFLKNLKKAKGDYRAREFSEKRELIELSKYISSSLTFSYLALEKPNEETLEKLKEKNPKFHRKILQKDFHLPNVIPGWRAIRTLDKPENINYLFLSKELDIPFDKFGVIGKNVEEIKKEVDKRGEEIIENYSKNKEKYLPYLDSLLGYGEKHKGWLSDILKIDDLWEFKTSHLDKDLKSVLDEFKNLKTETGKRKEKESSETYIKNLEQYLKVEQFSKVRERVSLIKEENRERALELIEKAEKVINLLKQEKIPDTKDISLILANKGILKRLNIPLTWDSIRTLSAKLTQGEREEKYSGSVEILKNPEEHLGAMDIDPSCMRVKGGFSFGALTVAQGPIFIIGIKDKFRKIKGRSLLIPVKDESGKWRFELNNTYGLGREDIEDFSKKIEETLKKKKKDYYKGTEKIITTDYKLEEGELPKSKRVFSTQRPEFWRDSTHCMVELEEAD